MEKIYNFKIDEKDIVELDQLWKNSKFDKKADFLLAMREAFKKEKMNSLDTQLDLSRYDEITDGTKEIIFNAFKHILATLEANGTNIKQQAIFLESEKEAMLSQKEKWDRELERVKAKYTQEILQLKEIIETKERQIEKFKEEFAKVEKIGKIEDKLEMLLKKIEG